MSKAIDYKYNFYEAIEKCLLEGYFIRGDKFKDGVYVMRDEDNTAVVVDGFNLHRVSHKLMLTTGLLEQRYKVFSIATKGEITK